MIITQEQYRKLNDVCYAVIGAAIEVHKHLGPGLLESIYHKCLLMELEEKGVAFKSEVEIPLLYKGVETGKTFRLDLLVEDEIIVELKSVDKLDAVHDAQLITYLKLTEKKLGLLINFNVPILRQGIKRIINGKIEYTGIKPIR